MVHGTQLENPALITTIVSAIVALLTALITYYTQRPKLRAEEKTAAEQADDLIFTRLKKTVDHYSKRVEDLEKDRTEDRIQIDKLKSELAIVRGALNQSNAERDKLVEKVDQQDRRIAALEKENKQLKRQNEQLVKLVGTDQLGDT